MKLTLLQKLRVICKIARRNNKCITWMSLYKAPGQKYKLSFVVNWNECEDVFVDEFSTVSEIREVISEYLESETKCRRYALPGNEIRYTMTIKLKEKINE